LSHELRTPMNAIVGFTQLLEARAGSALDPVQRHWLEVIKEAGRHVVSVLDECLAASQPQCSNPEHGPLMLSGLIDICVSMVSECAAQRGIEIETDVSADPQVSAANVAHVRQVLLNLLSNAVKYNRDGGHVLVRARAAGPNTVAIEVSDDGLGMTPEQLDALFQPYNRLGRECSGIEGSGIGLVIAKQVAEEMGGSLCARSRAGQGSIFTLVLPDSA
jgi:signal transduction histidine kinase